MPPEVLATVYFVDSANGADSQSGLSPSNAWRTLGRVSLAQVSPGDYILLKRGGVWNETFSLPTSGVPDVPVTIGAYGSGPRPLLDGSRFAVIRYTDMISANNRSDVVISGIEVRNATRNGINLNGSARIVIRDVAVSGSRQFGIMIFDSNSIAVEGSEISGNALDTSVSYDGIRIDGSGGELSGFVVRNCHIHDNVGGEGWNSANGIFLGHTGGMRPVLRGVLISANELGSNGNPDQNQAGRGLTGTFTGDVSVYGNYVHDNASAGIYLGDHGVSVDIILAQNIFYNNALRQFGGYTDSYARAFHNAIFVDNGALTAMGAEIGGAGTWEITNNAFYYQTGSADVWRGFIRVNDASADSKLQSDWNLFYSPGTGRWKLSDGISLDFPQWRSAGFDQNSKAPK